MRIAVRHMTSFARDEGGSIFILWSIFFVAIIGFAALVFDIGRVQMTHGELQSYADNVALAAAGELDGEADAITRATAAAAAYIDDTNTFGGDGELSGAVDYALTFLNGLPEDDTDPITGFITTEPEEAYLVQVIVTPVSFGVPFLRALRALNGTPQGTGNATVSAGAIAGFTQEACDVTPLMFCIPSGWSAADPANIGQEILLRTGGQGAAWGPGDFGFLDTTAAQLGTTCAGLTGAKLVACVIGAETNRTRCYSQRGVTTEPGQKVGLMNAAFNTRFDQFRGVLTQFRNDAAYTVAPNIISGEIPNGACGWNNTFASTNSIGLPHDSCFSAGTCTRFGNGNWDYETYIDTNHGDANGTMEAGEDAHLTPHIPAEFAGTRYGVYVAEIEYAKTAGLPGGAILNARDETGLAQCSSNVSPDPKRRVLIAAAIDCAANPIQGTTTNVPVEEWVEVFMVRPVGSGVGSPPSFDLWVEVIGVVGLSGFSAAGDGGVFRDVVQLYR